MDGKCKYCKYYVDAANDADFGKCKKYKFSTNVQAWCAKFEEKEKNDDRQQNY